MKLITLAALLIASIANVHAAEPAKITVREALSLAAGLRNLDGRQVIIKQNGQDAAIIQAWEFANASLRLKIASDLSIVSTVEQVTEQARQNIVREVLKTHGGGNQIHSGTPAFDEYQKQYDEILNQPAAGTQDLARIKASDLKLDRNEIPITVLSALKPILDVDQ